MLIGLQARPVADPFIRDRTGRVAVLALCCVGAVFTVRFLWLEVSTLMIRLLDRRASQRARRVSILTRLVTSWGGFRGAVSLAAALALPRLTPDGDQIPDRDVIIAVTFVVITFTIFVQGSTMPALVRRARLQEDPALPVERRLAATRPLENALRHLAEDARRLGVADHTRDEIRRILEHELESARRSGDAAVVDEPPDSRKEKLLVAAVTRRRTELIRLRDQGSIDDGVLLGEQEHLDLEELRFTGRER